MREGLDEDDAPGVALGGLVGGGEVETLDVGEGSTIGPVVRHFAATIVADARITAATMLPTIVRAFSLSLLLKPRHRARKLRDGSFLLAKITRVPPP